MYLGIDFGTSGCRACVIDDHRQCIAESRLPLPRPDLVQDRLEQSAQLWTSALEALLRDLAQKVDLSQIQRLAFDGTSGTVLICDANATALCPALMYNDQSSTEALKTIQLYCPETDHACLNPSSALAKAIQLITRVKLPQSYFITTQADYLAGWLACSPGFSDYHNALKLGYDPKRLAWPQWIKDLLPQNALPKVLEPGQILASVDPAKATAFGFSPELKICAGTTDANAAFLATGLHHLGAAVTSLGSTLVVKILNDRPINDAKAGIYSHRLGDLFLVGGASNAGAAILDKFFDIQQVKELSKQITLSKSTGLNYYPLLRKGERFPIQDPEKEAILTPRPNSDVAFLQGLLEGLTAIEHQGYEKLVSMGAKRPTLIYTSGGGSENETWQLLRQQVLQLPVKKAEQSEASFGTALLAQSGLNAYKLSTES